MVEQVGKPGEQARITSTFRLVPSVHYDTWLLGGIFSTNNYCE